GEVNVAPVLGLIADQGVQQESLLTFTATATDADDPANTLTFSLDGTPPTGAAITSGGVFTWTPTTTQGPGDFDITVRVTDDGTPNLNDTQTFTVTVSEEANVAPVLALIGDRSVDELTALAFTATATDANDPAQTLTFSLDGTPPTGAGITSGGAFTWTPSEAQGPGSYDVTVRVTDDGTPNLSDTETITITVNEVNSAPTANPQTVDTDEDTGVNIVLTGSDPDGDTPLAFAIATQPGSGTLVGTAPNVRYSPDPGFNGTDSFTFTVSDAEETSLPATVTIDVAPVNDAPTADPQSVTTDEDVALPIVLTGSDPETDPLTFDIATPPANGALSGSPPNVTYTPDPDFNGSDSFSFTAADASLTSPAATVSISVNPVNDPPTAVDDSFDVTEGGTTVPGLNVLANDTDPDESPPNLTASLLSAPTLDPTMVLNADGTFTYTHDDSENLTDSFTYEACDGGGLCSGTATVTISVDSVND
ncbi:MAG: Ig-like domain-containing protein, partial [Proteobacteria bacterium]|nr:Ig-like domain-containing protein [Pseudomonadota bacterium]